MRTFIVSLSVLLLFSSFVIYGSDMNSYMQLQRELKAAAEECAGGGALMLDDRSFAEGRIMIDEQAAQAYAERVLQSTYITCPPLKHGSLSVSARLLSDDSIEMTVTYTADEGYDLFRLPFLTRTTVTRSAAYAWE